MAKMGATMKKFLIATALLAIMATSALAGGRSPGLASWSAGSMPPLQGFGRGNYYGAGGLQYGHRSNRVYGSTPPLYGWVLVVDAWGNTYYQWQQVGCK